MREPRMRVRPPTASYDARLRRIVDLMIASPADRGTLEFWAKRAGLSFGRWRQ